MITIKNRGPLSSKEINFFLKNIDFELPKGFIEFFGRSNGAMINGKNVYIVIWPLTDMLKLNKDYKVDEYATGFFIFGSDGGDTAYCIEKKTAHIYEMPFIGMSYNATFICDSFTDFLQSPPQYPMPG